MNNIASEVREFVIDNYMYGQNADTLENDESLLERGIIDSAGILELVMFLEETYDMKVADDELLPDNLDSVDRISAYVGRKQASKHLGVEVVNAS